MRLALEFTGSPDTLSATLPVKLPFVVNAIEYVAFVFPVFKLLDGGVAESRKSLIVAVKLRLFVHTPSVVVTVMSELPAWFGAGQNVSVRDAPLPFNDRLPPGIKV
jgi:hypothetical protein